jgi:hypothetical protein
MRLRLLAVRGFEPRRPRHLLPDHLEYVLVRLSRADVAAAGPGPAFRLG